MRFSAGSAVFEGFRVTRQHPFAVLAWTAFSLVVLIALAAVSLPTLLPIAAELSNVMTGKATALSDDAQARLESAALLTAPISLVAQAVLLPALYRAMETDGRDRFGFLRLGKDELRVLGALALVFLITVAVGQLGDQLTALTTASAGGIVGALISLLASVASIFVSVRLALAVPAAFSEQRLDVRSMVKASKGAFWVLLGMAIIVGLLALVVIFLLAIVALPVYGALAQQSVGQPGSWLAGGVALILMALGMALTMVIVSAPFMTAYQGLKPSAPD